MRKNGIPVVTNENLESGMQEAQGLTFDKIYLKLCKDIKGERGIGQTSSPPFEMTTGVREKVFITGAAGQTGRSILSQLVEFREKKDISAGIYAEEAGQQKSILGRNNVPTVPVDGMKPEMIENALRDVSTLELIPVGHEKRIAIAKNFINAAKRCPSMPRVILLSTLGADREDYYFAKQFREIERELESSSFQSWTVVRPNFYAENFLHNRGDVQKGTLRLPIEKGKFSPLLVEDVGAMVKHILRSEDLSEHNKKYYELSGPEALNGEKIAEVASESLHRPIKFENISNEMTCEILTQRGAHPDTIKGLLEFYDVVKKGSFNATSTQDFERICGRKPKQLSEFFTRYAENFN